MTESVKKRDILNPYGEKLDPLDALKYGLIQEANRQFFHPLGMALAVVEFDDGQPPYLELHVSDDPEGMAFDRLDDGLSEVKAKLVAARLQAISGPRTARLGFVVQPIGNVLDEPDHNG